MNTWLLNIQQQLSRQILASKLPHALLFAGVPNAGQEKLADWLINVLLCQALHQENVGHEQLIIQPCGQCKTCKLFLSSSYPDHLSIISDKSTIGVDAIRKLSQFFEKTAHIGQAKTALVNHADQMTISAANALLKTLEEPTSNSFIILTTDRSDLLLPTIISRCQRIEVRPPVGEKLLAEFNKQGDDAFVNLTHLNELTDEGAAVAYNEFRAQVVQYLSAYQCRAEVLVTLAGHTDSFRWLEKVLVDLMREQSGWKIAASDSTLNKQQLWQIYSLAQAANTKLKTLVQVNRQFLSEKLLADICFAIQNSGQK
ncbi:DNA polymerase III subunit delta' [Colwellia sp. M166]|uniref:DNA polymerase III subunit delta' n=1 Tax=Colwellia sp. M166 TaxID=2583805 RepID=UPI00211DC809|nr:DNA polymerase III subunit delta' [Colwellia sp. M166]UUO22355.1 DNA polymerase III subunit delta' [Colwellia sp. M166]|tara:strand:- start:59759 stop:60697 length:939 start_codon:yes stop_codon:yes gene_type:complete